jgi:hypothetical protein
MSNPDFQKTIEKQLSELHRKYTLRNEGSNAQLLPPEQGTKTIDRLFMDACGFCVAMIQNISLRQILIHAGVFHVKAGRGYKTCI